MMNALKYAIASFAMCVSGGIAYAGYDHAETIERFQNMIVERSDFSEDGCIMMISRSTNGSGGKYISRTRYTIDLSSEWLFQSSSIYNKKLIVKSTVGYSNTTSYNFDAIDQEIYLRSRKIQGRDARCGKEECRTEATTRLLVIDFEGDSLDFMRVFAKMTHHCRKRAR